MGKQRRNVEKKTDLSSLETINDDSLCTCLKARHEHHQPYTNVGHSHLVAIKPNRPVDLNDDETSLNYAAAYKDTNPKPAGEPHIFELVNRAYFYMRRTGNDQAMITSGESASGKTHIRHLIIRHLVRLSSHKKETKTQTQLLQSLRVLDAFGCAASTVNPDASRFGYYVEIQFSERGRMVGAKALHYFLEKSRLTGPGDKGGNFSVFYQLLAGASPEERSSLQLQSNAGNYGYLARYKRSVTPSDAEQFSDLRVALKQAGFRREHVSRIFQLLAAILHLGNLTFVDPGGSNNNQDAAYVKNTELLDLVADFLGVDPRALENVLVFKTTMIRKDVTTLILNAEQAKSQRDALATALYALLFSWMVEKMNGKMDMDSDKFSSIFGVLDLPGPQMSDHLHAFIVNVAAERVHGFVNEQLFVDVYENEGIQIPSVASPYDTQAMMDLLHRPSRGICPLIHSLSERQRKGKRLVTDSDLVDSLIKYNNNNPAFEIKTATGSRQRHFAIQHFHGQVTYDPTHFLADNQDQVPIDFVSLFRGEAGATPTHNNLLLELWDKTLATEAHPNNAAAVVSATQKPTRSPSLRQSQRRRKEAGPAPPADSNNHHGLLAHTLAELDGLINALQDAKLWRVMCIRPSDSQQPNVWDSRLVRAQIKALGLASLAQHEAASYAVAYTHAEFLERYAQPLRSRIRAYDSDRLPRAQCVLLTEQLGWTNADAAVGNNRIFLADHIWRMLEDELRVLEKEEQRRTKEINRTAPTSTTDDVDTDQPLSENDPEALVSQIQHTETTEQSEHTEQTEPTLISSALHDKRTTGSTSGLARPFRGRSVQEDQHSFYSEDRHDGSSRNNEDSLFGSDSIYNRNDSVTHDGIQQQANKEDDYDDSDEDKDTMSSTRRRWLLFVQLVTWWIPNSCLTKLGGMKRHDVRQAWREKLALCIIILFMCLFIVWFLVFFGEIVCPHQAVFSPSELESHSDKSKAYVAIRGEVFDLTKFAPHHYPDPSIVPTSSLLNYAGTDATSLFPVQVSDLCQGTTGVVSPFVSYDYNVNYSDPNAAYHDFRYASGMYRPNWYFDKMTQLRRNYKVGNMGYEPKTIRDQADTETMVAGSRTTRNWAVIDNHVYDLTVYTREGRYLAGPPGVEVPSDISTDYIDLSIVSLFRTKAGSDITHDFYKLPMSDGERYQQLVCLRNLFYVGMVDTRNSAKCQFSTYLLLTVTALLCSVIVFKFIAAFRVSGQRAPEEHDKFVICQVTCYTEDEESLRRTFESIAMLRYDDKRKLLFVICDGMIVGSGNDRPTPRIVLDILGVDPQVDPEPLSFISVGEGQRQHNMGKIYSGLYEVQSHVVPYIVVVKCGKATERQKPGNRGKRDSQLVLMNFLNRVHFDTPMTPLQLEIYHQMKNVIGVQPSVYDFVLMVDADTVVMPDSLNNLVSSAVRDSRILGICGETTLANEKATWVTMIQVYEYFISHHMTKAFESLFSSVTCLPGCFTMYRIRTVDGRRALLAANEVISDYGVNKVETLHQKNLLLLGEDRYLTTLLLKHFPNYKTKFTPHAQCQTNAPDIWSVLVSQRRRWINSTIHNLGELVFLQRLCGFCCFSMRFVVMLDLVSTLVMPAIVAYLGYLIYKLVTIDNMVPILTIIVLAGTYGLQAVLFMIKRKWDYILWMLVSILAIPVFWFYIPIYAYWHFDDFSWGNTRIVVGEKGKKRVVTEEGEFDPKSIPTMTWSQYEKMLVSEDYWSDNMSQGSSSRSSHTRLSRARATTLSEPMYPSGMSVGGQGGVDAASLHTHSMMMSPVHVSQPSVYMEGGSTMMPASVSLPIMQPMFNMQMPRASMASFAAQQEPWQPPSQQRRSSRASFPMQGAHRDSSSQSLLMDELHRDQGPSNEEIFAQVQRILSSADLNKITKKQVREELQQVFGVPMTGRKDYINACIENVLQDRV